MKSISGMPEGIWGLLNRFAINALASQPDGGIAEGEVRVLETRILIMKLNAITGLPKKKFHILLRKHSGPNQEHHSSCYRPRDGNIKIDIYVLEFVPACLPTWAYKKPPPPTTLYQGIEEGLCREFALPWNLELLPKSDKPLLLIHT